jgi:hypothetical protein
VLSDRAKIGPEDKLQRRDKIGGSAGYVYAEDDGMSSRIAGNEALMKRLKNLRLEYQLRASRRPRYLHEAATRRSDRARIWPFMSAPVAATRSPT